MSAGAGIAIILAAGVPLGLLASGSLDGIGTSEDPGVLRTIMDLADEPGPSFPVVTP